MIFRLLCRRLELVEDVRAHRRHACPATDEDHFGVGVFGEKFAEGAGDGDFVAWLEAEDVAGHDARLRFRDFRRWGRNTDVKHDDAFFVRVVRHRVGTHGRFVVVRFDFE